MTRATITDLRREHRLILARAARNTAAEHRAAAAAAKTRGLGQAFVEHFTAEAELLERLAKAIEDCCAERGR